MFQRKGLRKKVRKSLDNPVERPPLPLQELRFRHDPTQHPCSLAKAARSLIPSAGRWETANRTLFFEIQGKNLVRIGDNSYGCDL